MKKVLSVALIIVCVGVFACWDAYAAKPDKGEKVNGVSRLTHSGDIKGTFTLPGSCVAAETDAIQLLVYIPGVSIAARPLKNNAGDYDFVLYNVPEGPVNVVLDVVNITEGTFVTAPIQTVSVQKQRVSILGTQNDPFTDFSCTE